MQHAVEVAWAQALPDRDGNAERAEKFTQRFEHYRATRGFVPNSIRTMARRPSIALAFMDLNRAVLYEGTVSEELKMLVSLVASQASGCRYCQAHMANLARIYRASAERIAAGTADAAPVPDSGDDLDRVAAALRDVGNRLRSGHGPSPR